MAMKKSEIASLKPTPSINSVVTHGSRTLLASTLSEERGGKFPSLPLFTQTGTQVAQLCGCELEVLHRAMDLPLNSVTAGQVSALRF